MKRYAHLCLRILLKESDLDVFIPGPTQPPSEGLGTEYPWVGKEKCMCKQENPGERKQEICSLADETCVEENRTSRRIS